VTGLITLIVVAGAAWLPPIIRFFGRGGQRETVEWLVFLALGTAFPVIAAGWAVFSPRMSGQRFLRGIDGALGVFLLVCGAAFVWTFGPAAILISVALTVVTMIGAEWVKPERPDRDPASLIVSAVVLAAAWSSVITLASWTRPWDWAVQSYLTPLLLFALIGCAVPVLFAGGPNGEEVHAVADDRRFTPSVADIPALLAFIILSFRTAPIVEFYHWSFWVGPIEALRQGGWLLWDVPSQYGFFSVLIPALLPLNDAWQALYLLQAILYVVVATAIYGVVKGLRRGIAGRVLAIAFTASALFFRPRTSALILPAQMTPAGGPMRFFWCYAILAVLVWKYTRGDKVSARRFAIVGTLVWIASVAWSAESAIYCTVAWVGAFGVFAVQRAFVALHRSGEAASEIQATGGTSRVMARYAAVSLGLFTGGILSAVALTSLVYQIFEGHGPDWAAYYEYALLFSGGYSALPIDGFGSVWYLIVIFAAVSTAVIQFLILDPRHPRVFVAVGSLGMIWAISSYFVSRSHPVNLLSLIPLLVFAFVIVLYLCRSLLQAYWVRLVNLAAVPLICFPAALTYAHGGFLALLGEPQMPMTAISTQVPVMEPSLATLAGEAGIERSDPVFFASDGKFLLPRWPATFGGRAATSEQAWMPKPYEVISTLPPTRRDAYVERFADRVGSGGWLIQEKAEINPGYESVVRLIEKSHAPVESFENESWIIKRYRRSLRSPVESDPSP